MELNSRRMLGVLFLTIALAVCAPARSQSFSYNPVADESAVVVCGNARFTVLTSRLVRMEWADDATFEDRATLAVVNRHLEVPAFRVSRTRKGVTIRTKDLTLRYKGPGKFAEGNLCVEFTLNGKKVKWHPGADESGNLMGTFRTLDGKPYKLVPLPLPDALYLDDYRLPGSYANFLIINGAVLIPGADSPKDAVAAARLQQVFPDRKVEIIDCRALLSGHGGLHCITMNYPEGY